MDITEIVVAAIGLLSAILTAAVLPWMRAKLGMQRFEQLRSTAKIAAGAAEQIYGAGFGQEKLAYAVTQMRVMLTSQGIVYDEQAVRAVLEAAVREL